MHISGGNFFPEIQQGVVAPFTTFVNCTFLRGDAENGGGMQVILTLFVKYRLALPIQG